MPIVDILVVEGRGTQPGPLAAQAIADALAPVFSSAPGRVWVRLQSIGASQYAENGVAVGADEHPVFVKVQLAHLPVGEALAAQLVAVTESVASCLSRSASRVHVEYAPPGAGRMAFGGVLVP
jgi:phenylpyruvate tautomerase PptA (4-oxalocrotonate tautomerase family)